MVIFEGPQALYCKPALFAPLRSYRHVHLAQWLWVLSVLNLHVIASPRADWRESISSTPRASRSWLLSPRCNCSCVRDRGLIQRDQPALQAIGRLQGGSGSFADGGTSPVNLELSPSPVIPLNVWQGCLLSF